MIDLSLPKGMQLSCIGGQRQTEYCLMDAAAPLLIAPTDNTDMWDDPIQKLDKIGFVAPCLRQKSYKSFLSTLMPPFFLRTP